MGEEVVKWYERFVSKLPSSERDMPYLKFRGRFWAPNEVLSELEQGSEIGKEFQEMKEGLRK